MAFHEYLTKSRANVLENNESFGEKLKFILDLVINNEIFNVVIFIVMFKTFLLKFCFYMHVKYFVVVEDNAVCSPAGNLRDLIRISSETTR